MICFHLSDISLHWLFPHFMFTRRDLHGFTRQAGVVPHLFWAAFIQNVLQRKRPVNQSKKEIDDAVPYSSDHEDRYDNWSQFVVWQNSKVRTKLLIYFTQRRYDQSKTSFRRGRGKRGTAPGKNALCFGDISLRLICFVCFSILTHCFDWPCEVWSWKKPPEAIV